MKCARKTKENSSSFWFFFSLFSHLHPDGIQNMYLYLHVFLFTSLFATLLDFSLFPIQCLRLNAQFMRNFLFLQIIHWIGRFVERHARKWNAISRTHNIVLESNGKVHEYKWSRKKRIFYYFDYFDSINVRNSNEFQQIVFQIYWCNDVRANRSRRLHQWDSSNKKFFGNESKKVYDMVTEKRKKNILNEEKKKKLGNILLQEMTLTIAHTLITMTLELLSHEFLMWLFLHFLRFISGRLSRRHSNRCVCLTTP